MPWDGAPAVGAATTAAVTNDCLTLGCERKGERPVERPTDTGPGARLLGKRVPERRAVNA